MQDQNIYQAIQDELHRQQHQINLIASENFVSPNVLQAQGSILTNKYAEGYPGRRYYGGCNVVDVVEGLAIQRACKLFKCQFANVQPHSGSQANQAVFLALLKPFDTVLGMDLSSGGHLTHGSMVNLSGKWFQTKTYDVDPNSYLIDYDHVQDIAVRVKPKLIIAGGSAYSRIIDFQKFKNIASLVGAYLLVDMAHFAGLVAGGVYPSPIPFADVVTSTTHKTLRGPRGGLILTNDEGMAKKIDSAVFPGLQGGPLMHTIAAKAVAFLEALDPSFKTYTTMLKDNAQTLAQALIDKGLNVLTKGTDSHLMLVDVSPKTGKDIEKKLALHGIICNKNAIPYDVLSPMITSGIRIGTPACTTRGFDKDAFLTIANWIAHIVQTESVDENLCQEVKKLCEQYPIYENIT